MLSPSTTSAAVRGLLTVAVAILCAAGVRAAEEPDAPAASGPSAKALLDEALADWDDPAAKQAILREIHDVLPARLTELQGVAERNHDAALEMAGQMVEQANRLVDLKNDEPREYERAVRLCRLEDECLGLAQKARAAQGAAREPLVASLKQKLSEAFDAKQDTMTRQIAAMEAELDELRRRATKRSESRDALIERRALDLLGDRDAEW
jgi:hypothetical protein